MSFIIVMIVFVAVSAGLVGATDPVDPTSSQAPLVSGAYYESGGDLFVVQLTVDVENQNATFEFIINNDCLSYKLDYPKYWKVENMKYEYDADKGTLSFLNTVEEQQNPVIQDMKNHFAEMGEFPLPVVATIMPDGRIHQSILLLTVSLERQSAPVDMAERFAKFQKMKNNKPRKINTTPAPVQPVQGIDGGSLAATNATNTTTKSSSSFGGHQLFLVLLPALIIMWAEGSFDWLRLI